MDKYSFAVTSCPADLSEEDEMLAENIHNFAHMASFIEASMVGGKITPKEAMKGMKDLYKTLKHNNKNLKMKK
jgi:hypothetical protein